jgi:hypothetical protein
MAMQVTLVSLYGKKSNSRLAAVIAQCQQIVTNALSTTFTPYDEEQVHATIVGLERRSRSRFENDNFARLRNRNQTMAFDGFLGYLRGCGHFPLQVQIGGFRDRCYPFTSRRANPYERSFSIQGDKAVVMGWPIRGEPVSMPETTSQNFIQESRIYPMTLDAVRRAAQGFGILHAYHQALTDVDNDLFFRIGLVEEKAVLLENIPALEQRVRQFLSEEIPLIVEITLDEVFVAAYKDNTLPRTSTNVWSVTDPKVDGQLISGLYK